MAVKIKVKKELITNDFALYCGDCITTMPLLKDDSVGMCCHSPPFADLFSYSDDPADMGNCKDYTTFFVQYGFLVDELYRAMLPGRIVAVHCMDLPLYKNKGEEIGLRDFSGDIIRLFKKKGFIFHSRHCIWKDPLIAATRTKALGLAHKQLVKDSSMSRTGIPDYLLAFRKQGDNPVPIVHPNGLTEYAGSREIPRNLDRYMLLNPLTNEPWTQGENKRSHWIWQQYASPVWFDIRQTRVLSYKAGKDKDDQRHLCPLQRDVVERCMVLWSNPEEIVLDPFAGVGTVPYIATQYGRKGVGIELKLSYWKQARENLQSLKHQKASTRGFSKNGN